ncbi:MAG: L,D-transpeptidase, partial [Clostridia bacterium]|nr:L,D-transpeptidase [Clostridia bacterium]
TPEPTATPITPTPGEGYDLPYYLYVEKGSFTLTIYQRDDNGGYTKIYAQYRVAHGGNKTPNGVFELTDRRERWREFPKGGCTQFAVAYQGNLFTHSPMYGSFDNHNMWPKYYDGEKGIGTDSTGGCIRMVTEAARFIYENCAPGTKLEIVLGSPRGTTSPEPPDRNGLRQDPTDIEA